VYVNLCIDNNYRKIIIKEYLNFINFFRDNISIYEWNSDSKSIYEPKVIDNNIIASSNDFNNSKKVSSLYDYELREALNIINPSWVSNLELRTGEGGIKYDIRK